MAKIVIYIQGGNYQGAVADVPGVELLIVDYDNEAEQANPDRSFEPVAVDARAVSCAAAGKDS